MKIREHRIGSLNVIDVNYENFDEIIILLHGFGANKEDLFPLHQSISTRKKTRWIFPDAPLELNLGGFNGRAWFPILASHLEYVKSNGLDFSNLKPDGLDQANQKINELLDSLKFPYSKITLGGFSQGAMLSTDVVLRNEDLPNGILILSGTLINESEWKVYAEKKSKLQFFQTHGILDPVLQFDKAKKLENLLREAKLSGEFHSFQGGHEIPSSILKKVSEYLKR
jgi:phospholipase/carboxylesterase